MGAVTQSETEIDLDDALTAMSEAGRATGWIESDCRAVLKRIDEEYRRLYRRLYARAPQRDRAMETTR